MNRRRPHWRNVAAALGAALPRSRLHPAVLAWAEANRRSRSVWHVALSGGADSVALLLLLWQHWPERRARLRALHFDHRLRGAASRADAAFCRRLCAALDVPIEVAAWNRPRGARRPSEAAAREARMAFFARHTGVLWLGHHQDDIAETMLMRLARGSGAGGLSAPRPIQKMPGGRLHLRPLLTIGKAGLAQALAEAGGIWREDATNVSPDYFRNRVRRDVVRVWVCASQRDAVAGAARSRELLAEDDEALESWLEELAVFGRSGDLLLSRLAGKPRALVRRALHRWLRAASPDADLSRQAFEALLLAVERGRPTRHSLGTAAFAVIRRGRLQLSNGIPARKFQRRVN